MRARLEHLRERVVTSIWILPALMSAGAAALALGLLRLDAALPGFFVPAALGFRAGPAAAQALLTTLAGATMSTTGVTFSITVVALSLASQQFGPRIVRAFVRDRASHLVLGTFLGTFLYSILVLQAIEVDAAPEDLPYISVTGAMALGVASLAALIYFVHHVAHAIQADHVISEIARELERDVDRMYPRVGEGRDEDETRTRAPDDFADRARAVRAKRSGYLQSVDEEDLLAFARRHDVVVRIVPRPGDFVTERSPMLLAVPGDRVDEEFEDEARKLLILGRKRTPEQDVEFSIDQLVEVAVRALSPGVNDPFTAMRCVDRLGAALCRLAWRRFPSPYREDDDGRLRVIAPRPSFPGLVEAAFTPIRQHAQTSVAVTIRLFETLEVVAGCARTDEQRDAIRAQIEKVWTGARAAGHSPPDQADVERRYRDALAALDLPAGPTGVPMQPAKRGSP